LLLISGLHRQIAARAHCDWQFLLQAQHTSSSPAQILLRIVFVRWLPARFQQRSKDWQDPLRDQCPMNGNGGRRAWRSPVRSAPSSSRREPSRPAQWVAPGLRLSFYD
jgi:hypothetical protein